MGRSHWPGAIGVYVSLLTLIVGLAGSTQAFSAQDELGSWFIVSSTDRLPGAAEGSPWRYGFDAQFRWVNDDSNFQQSVLRPSIGYRLQNTVTLWFGYGRFDTDQNDRPSRFENRYWQQATWRVSQWRGGTLSARFRLEQRILSTGDDLGLVARLLFRYTKPFPKHPRRYWTVAMEPFFDFKDTDWGANAGLSQNRVALSLGQTLRENLTFELGYMNQYFFRENTQDRSNHLLTLHLKVNF